MDIYPEIKSSAVPNLMSYEDSNPTSHPNCFMSWNDYRNERKAKINQSSQPFELINLDIGSLETDLGFFKIIQDDCNDLIDFLKCYKTLLLMHEKQ